MRRYFHYITTAFVTFAVGLTCSLVLGTNDGIFVSQARRFINRRGTSTEERRQPVRVSGIAGSGMSDDGYPTSFSDSDFEDGSYVHQLSIFYGSPERANSELQNRIASAREIIRREPVLDKDGNQIGERVVAKFASHGELLWTEHQHGRFVIQKRRSVQDILNALDGKR